MPLVQVRLDWLPTTALGQIKGRYERLTLCQHWKKTSHKYQWAHFLTKRKGLLLKDNWWLIGKNTGKRQSNRFLQNDTVFGDQGPRMQANFMLRIEIKKQGKYTSKIFPTKWQPRIEHFDAPGRAICKEHVFLAPSHFVCFLQIPTLYSCYRMGGLDPLWWVIIEANAQ